MTKGHITIGVASLVSAITIAVGIVGSYYTSQLTVQDKIAQVKLEGTTEIAEVKKDLAVNDTRDTAFEDRLNRFERKLDLLLERNGVNPAIINPAITLATSTNI